MRKKVAGLSIAASVVRKKIPAPSIRQNMRQEKQLPKICKKPPVPRKELMMKSHIAGTVGKKYQGSVRSWKEKRIRLRNLYQRTVLSQAVQTGAIMMRSYIALTVAQN